MIGVVIGRFQPFHNSHKDLIDHALETSGKVVVIVGSSFRSRLPRNPFTFEERRDVIRKIYPNISIEPCEDHITDEAWAQQVASIISGYTAGYIEDVCIYGNPVDNDCNKNSLKGLAYKYQDYVSELGIRASQVRALFYENQLSYGHLAPSETIEFLEGFDSRIRNKLAAVMTRNLFTQGIYVTVDNVVSWRDCIALVKRKDNGLYALPGGYLEKDERVATGALRELEEETGLTKDLLTPDKNFVIDNINRSGFGRLISHVYKWRCDDFRDAPNVKGGDDAKEAVWVHTAALHCLKERFHDDHYQIINYARNGVYI